MPRLPTDPTKIDNNPFADVSYLRRELERFAEFFDGIPKDADDLHAVWKRYQNRRGDTAAVQLSLGIDTLRMLDAIHKQLLERGEDGIPGLVILFHIALLEQVEQGQYLAFTDWLLGRLKDVEPPLPTGIAVDAIKNYVLFREQEYESEHGAAKSVTRALQRGLSAQDKRTLLLGFKFSVPYPAPEEKRGLMHVHCRELKAAGTHVDPGCIQCLAPAEDDLDRYIGLLARHLYAMRSMLVHRAMWVWFVGIEIPMEGVPPTGEGSMVDGYYDRQNRIIMYRTGLLLERLVSILRRCIWSRLAQ